MKRALLLLVFMTSAVAAEPNLVLSADGLGPIAIGINTDKLKQVLIQRLAYAGGCRIALSPTKDLTGISLVVEGDILTRIDVEFYGNDPHPLTIKTAVGIGLKSPEEDVIKAYAGHIRIQSAPLDPSWHTLSVDSTDRPRGMIFETDGKTVKSIRVGSYPSISNREPCK